MEREKRNIRKLAWLLFIATLALTRAEASSINLISEDRFVCIANTAPAPYALLGGVATTNTPASSFNNAWLSIRGSIPWLETGGFKPAPTTASVRQDVAVDSGGVVLATTMDLTAGGDPLGLHLPAGATGVAHAESFFALTFSVDRPTGFVYEYTVSEGPGLQMAELVIEADALPPRVLAPTGAAGAGGLLDTGTYILRWQLIGEAAGDITDTVTGDLSFAVLPEPSTAMLIGAGFIVVAGARRRR
jgi:hypothetical protein